MRRALLVEDSMFFARLLLRYLRDIGYSVELHRGAVGARAACDGKTFDLYVIDVSIQENEAGGTANGLELVQWVKQRHPRAKVIVCSSDPAKAPLAMALGCKFVLKDSALSERLKDAISDAP